MEKINVRHKVVRNLLEVMTKEKLADEMRVSIFTIIAWKKGVRIPSFAAFYLLKKIHRKKIG